MSRVRTSSEGDGFESQRDADESEKGRRGSGNSGWRPGGSSLSPRNPSALSVESFRGFIILFVGREFSSLMEK